MVKIDVTYEGELRCQLTHGPSKTVIHTDAPVDNHGKGESFSPTDLVAAAMGSCMFTIMGIVAQREGIDLAGSTCSVLKEMTTQPPRKIARIVVEFDLPSSVSREGRQKLENAAKTCPVHKTLEGNVEVPIIFRWER